MKNGEAVIICAGSYPAAVKLGFGGAREGCGRYMKRTGLNGGRKVSGTSPPGGPLCVVRYLYWPRQRGDKAGRCKEV